jgi:nitrogen fixation NifU-like protein
LPLDIYAEDILSHYEHPHNKLRLKDFDASFSDENPLCGDTITIYIKVSNMKVSDISFGGDGCSISQSTASMLTDYVKGMLLEDVEKIDYDKIKELLGINLGPARMNCAMLPLKALHGAVKAYKNSNKATEK